MAHVPAEAAARAVLRTAARRAAQQQRAAAQAPPPPRQQVRHRAVAALSSCGRQAVHRAAEGRLAAAPMSMAQLRPRRAKDP